MFKQESITESHGIHAVWKPWLFGVLAVVCLLLIGMQTKIMADNGSAEEGFACHPGIISQDEISREPVCDRLSGALAAAGGPKSLKKYYHETCLGCHKNMHKAEKITGPVKCKGCHTK